MCVCVCVCVRADQTNLTLLHTYCHSIFSDVGHYVFDPKASSSSTVAKGNYFDQPAREKEVTAKGEKILMLLLKVLEQLQLHTT